MGRNKPKKNSKSKSATATTATSAAPATHTPSVQALLEKTQSLITQCDYELALRFISRILDQDPAHVYGKELLGIVQLETGDIEAAKGTFQSLLPPTPGAPSPPPPSAHLYLAQLNDGDPQLALQHYQAAVDILASQFKGKQRIEGESDIDDLELKNNIVRALIGQVEIWMDPSYDLCFEPNAEKTCENLLNQALQYDSENSEALQALASVRLSQQRPEDAKECLQKSWAAWKDLDLDDPKVPPIPTQLSLVKLFLELSLFSPALLVLHGVMSTDDQEVEAWYLEGWCYFMMAEHAQEHGGTFDDMSWQDLAKDARDRLETCQLLHVNENHPDAPLLDHVKELIGKLETLGITASPPDEADENAGEWEDVDSSGDEDGDVEMADS